MGNRCGHDRRNLRLCDVVRRGRGGQPQILGIVSAYLNHASRDRRKLRDWNTLNPSGRRRRTEQLEATLAVLQYLTANWLQVDTRRCVTLDVDHMTAPDVKHLARKISESPDWQCRTPLSAGRVSKALNDLVRAGYLARSKQVREQAPTGEWKAAPKITCFTKKLFMHLGGQRLWTAIRKKGQFRMNQVRLKMKKHFPSWQDVNQALKEKLNPGRICSPREAWRTRQARPPDPNRPAESPIFALSELV